MVALSDIITCFFSGGLDVDIFQPGLNYREALDDSFQLELLHPPQDLTNLHLLFGDLNP